LLSKEKEPPLPGTSANATPLLVPPLAHACACAVMSIKMNWFKLEALIVVPLLFVADKPRTGALL